MNDKYNVLFRYAFNNKEVDAKTKNEIAELIDSEGMSNVIAYIKKRKFVPFVCELLIRLGYNNTELKELLDCYSKRNQYVIEQLGNLFDNFLQHQVTRVVVVENFGAFLSSGADPIWRFGSGDVDLYGDINQKEAIYSAAQELGYECVERYSENNLISTRFINKDKFEDGFYFGIGWYPTARLKIPFLQYKSEVVDWNSVRKYKDTNILLPGIESLLYICMMHISVHDFSRQPDIRLYIDIQNCCSEIVDWGKIIEWAKRDGFKNRIATVAYLTNHLLDANIPHEVEDLCESDNHRKLISYVYDEKRNCLVDRSSPISSLKVEMLANDNSKLKGLLEILFPNNVWFSCTYGKKTVKSYCKYYYSLFK